MIDIAAPSDSRIIEFIRMSAPNSDLLTQEARTLELAAFEEWIAACVESPDLATAPKLSESRRAQPKAAVEAIRHTRKDRVLTSFVENVWFQVERCRACHSASSPQVRDQVERHGDYLLWIEDSPPATLRTLVDTGMMNIGDPANSLLLLKPTMQVEHGGGIKMEVGDLGYKQFRRFAEDYSAVVNGRYVTAKDLPAPSDTVYFNSEIWFKLSPTPHEWGDKLIGVEVYPYDVTAERFEETPIASGDRRVWGEGRLWQYNLVLQAAKGSSLAQRFAEEKRLPEGRYLIRIYCDADGTLIGDWQTELMSDRFFARSVEVTTAWPPGYGRMTAVDPTNRDLTTP